MTMANMVYEKNIGRESFNELHWIKDGSLLYASGKEDSTKKVCLYKSEDEGRTWNIVASFPSYNITEILAHGDTLFCQDRFRLLLPQLNSLDFN